MKKIISVGILISTIVVMAAGYSANVGAADDWVYADGPVSVVVKGNDVTFDWSLKHNPPAWSHQTKFVLHTSAGTVTRDLPNTEYTWTNFPVGYGWWWVEVFKEKLGIRYHYGETTAIQFHHQFPDDWLGYKYTTYQNSGHLTFIELDSDYTINLSEKFLVPGDLPDAMATTEVAGFYEDWSKFVSDPSLDWDFISFNSGVLTIKQGYRWDGASYPCKDFEYPNPAPRCIDDTFNIRSSMVHDALYDLMRMGYLTWDSTDPGDIPILDIPIEGCGNKGFDEGYSNREMADMLLYMVGIEEDQSKYQDLWPMHFWYIVPGEDGAYLHLRGAEVDYSLMREDIAAPATCNESRLARWKYHVSELTAIPTDGKVNLTWKPANEAGKEPSSHSALIWPHLGYHILRSQVVISSGGSTDPSTPSTALIDTVDSTDTTYLDNSVEDGITYIYQIKRVPNNLSPIPGNPFLFSFYDYSNTVQVTVINIAPTVDAGPDATFDEGDTFTYSGSFTDPGDDTWTATVDYGDGAGDQPLALTGKIFDLSHVYANDGVYTVTVTVTDNDAGVGSDTALITVDNVAPIVSIDSVDQPNPHFILPLVHTLTFNGSFSDPGWLDTHSSNWDFDDGTDVAGTLTEENAPPDSTGDSTSQHVYSSSGVYNVILGVMDNDGGIGTDTGEVTVISPVEAIFIINQYIKDLPGDAFKNNAGQRKNAFSNKLGEVLDMINAGDYLAAIVKLQNDIRAKADGYVGGNPKNDWIRVSAAQQEICSMVDDLIAYLGTM